MNGRKTFIFTTPVCSGTVTAFQYCYNTDSSAGINFVRFLSMSRNDLSFTVDTVRNVGRDTPPQDNICTNYTEIIGQRICCATTSFIRPLPITSSNFTFGVVMLSADSQLLTTPNNDTDMFLYPYFERDLPFSEINQNSVFTLESDNQTNGPLLLLRLLIGIAQ